MVEVPSIDNFSANLDKKFFLLNIKFLIEQEVKGIKAIKATRH